MIVTLCGLTHSWRADTHILWQVVIDSGLAISNGSVKLGLLSRGHEVIKTLGKGAGQMSNQLKHIGVSELTGPIGDIPVRLYFNIAYHQF